MELNKKKDKSDFIPWVEKYRPRTVNDVVYQDEVVSVLRKCLNGSDIPNMLFYGPPGTGKTSAILALAREMFGTLFKERVLELNASDERGISVVRERVKQFSLQTVTSKKDANGLTVPKIKLIILDECDSMTSAAQAALRRTMEKESKTTRFCLICNYVSRIIEPIASRCMKFRFKPLQKELTSNKLKDICGKERIKVDDGVVDEVIRISEGDLRKAITIMQSLHRLKSTATAELIAINMTDVHNVCGYIPNTYLKKFISTAKEKSVEQLIALSKDFIYEGYATSQLIVQLHDWTLNDENKDLTETQRAVFCEKIGQVDHQLLTGANEYIQLLNIGVLLIEILSPSK
ncbi:Replication factor C subunit 4 [Halotydeus destructor]|nr:Replication factor C subunit 4 [Halotydeus destructor]